jgi:hypothetical protein
MRLKLRGRTDPNGKPHDVSLWVGAVEVTVEAATP